MDAKKILVQVEIMKAHAASLHNEAVKLESMLEVPAASPKQKKYAGSIARCRAKIERTIAKRKTA